MAHSCTMTRIGLKVHLHGASPQGRAILAMLCRFAGLFALGFLSIRNIN